MKKINLVVIISFVLLIIDQLVKSIVISTGVNKVIIKNFLSFIYTENNGVAFSFLSGNRFLIIITTIFLVLALFYIFYKEFLLKNKTVYKIITFSFLFGGVFGNFIDRIVRGVVIDFISLKIFNWNFAIFNLADLFITIGVILLIILTIKDDSNKKNEL